MSIVLLDERFRTSNIKLVFLDLDGTILDVHGRVSPGVLHEVSRIRANGVKVSIATGRPYFGALGAIGQLKLDELGMFNSGATVLNVGKNKVLAAHYLDSSVLRKIIDFAREIKLYCEFYTDLNFFVESEQDIAEVHAGYLGRKALIADFDNIIHEPIIKAVVAVKNPDDLGKLEKIRIAIPEMNFGQGYGANHPHITFLNISSPLSDRREAFKIITEFYGITADQVAAFGDAESDTVFFEICGYGVAMGNAKPEVKQKAKFVTKSLLEDGVAWGIRMLTN